jgi:hypothetical protein
MTFNFFFSSKTSSTVPVKPLNGPSITFTLSPTMKKYSNFSSISSDSSTLPSILLISDCRQRTGSLEALALLLPRNPIHARNAGYRMHCLAITIDWLILAHTLGKSFFSYFLFAIPHFIYFFRWYEYLRDKFLNSAGLFHFPGRFYFFLLPANRPSTYQFNSPI